ncbi:alpha/beta fold hydrolase [Agitococcus lubricus]|uniref:Pimeloyl-ACP methyl ester carboxylesterase n=1 Tax=Agitococcus lubricus TaxID=1077255 RepID=A0A2T5J2M2_9GAMM|nr:alpha/beta hydrolase [Agitococcus lubricus]PTQ90773.1 pimeloyl-ACP methyl ester carboxylesterase [Agitococcus lubricus]
MVLSVLKEVQHYLGVGDLPVSTLKARYGQDAYYEQVLGVDVRIKESGQGEPLLVLHGFSASADTWDGWRTELSQHFRVIAIDVPPFAITGPLPFAKTTPQNVIHFINAVVEKLGITRFYLAGNSLGGYLAWNYTLHYPTKVKKLILIDSAGYSMPTPIPVLLMRTHGIRHLTKHVAPLPFVIQSVRSVYANPSLIPKGTIRRYQDLLRRTGTRHAIAAMMRGIVLDSPDIKLIRTPTLIMWGAKDTWIPPRHAHLFQRDIPHAKLVCYDDLGHIPMEEDPKRTAADARHFLTQ